CIGSITLPIGAGNGPDINGQAATNAASGVLIIGDLPRRRASDTIAIFNEIYRYWNRMTATLRLDQWALHLRNGAAGALRGRMLGALPPRMIEPELDEQLARVSRRTRIWELSNHLHCSIVGTCLSTGELRQILTKTGMAGEGAPAHHRSE